MYGWRERIEGDIITERGMDICMEGGREGGKDEVERLD